MCVRVWVAEGGVPYCNVNTMEMHNVQKNIQKNPLLASRISALMSLILEVKFGMVYIILYICLLHQSNMI